MRARNPEDLHRLFAAALNAGDRDALMSLYEPDATLVPQPGQAAIGKAAIRGALAGTADLAIGEGVLHPSLAAWIGDATPPELRGVVMGGYATANDLGGATGPIVGYAVAAALGFAWAYGLCVALMATALVAVAIGQPGRGSGVPPPRRSGPILRSY